MEKDKFIEKIQQIGTCEDEVERRTLLTQLSEEACGDYDLITQLQETNATLTKDNEKLREANMQMFLRIGEKKEPETIPQPVEKPKPKFEDLFNEKGGLK